MKRAALLLMLLASVPLYARRHRLPEYRAFPPSRQSLIDQNLEADRLGLPVIKTPGHLRELAQGGDLVPLSTSPALRINCPADRAYVRPWAADFVVKLAAEYYAAWGVPLQVNSATRPETVQRRLMRWNHNAAPIHGETASVHMRGIAVDLQRRGLTRRQKAWLQMRLLYWYGRGQVIVEEELRQPCFHVVVRGAAPEEAFPLVPSAAGF